MGRITPTLDFQVLSLYLIVHSSVVRSFNKLQQILYHIIPLTSGYQVTIENLTLSHMQSPLTLYYFGECSGYFVDACTVHLWYQFGQFPNAHLAFCDSM